MGENGRPLLRKTLPALLGTILLGIVLGVSGCSDPRGAVPDDLAAARKAMTKRDFLEAEKFFERYLKRNPESEKRWEVWNGLVELALSVRNDRKAATELLEAMLIEYADSPAKKREISVRLAELHRLARNYERAVALWSSVAEDPNADSVERARACRYLAHVYLRRLEFEVAKESLSYCLALDVPDVVRAECLYDLAQTHAGMGEVDNAVEKLRAVLALSNIAKSTRTLTTFMLADALDQKGENEEALALFTSISEEYPNRKVVAQRIEFLKNKKPLPVSKNGSR